MRFLSDAFLFPYHDNAPGLHFGEVFFVRAGTSGPKGPSPPSSLPLCCLISSPYPPQPSCTTYIPLFLVKPSKIPLLHPNALVFFVSAKAIELKIFGFPFVPMHRPGFIRCPNHPPRPLHRLVSLTSSPFCCPAIPLNRTIFGLFLASFKGGLKKVLSRLRYSSSRV